MPPAADEDELALETIGENDPRVKKLQEIAWGLQSVTNRPGNRLPEDAKRAAYRVTSRAIALCTNAEYVRVIRASWSERFQRLRRRRKSCRNSKKPSRRI
eukprot:s2647_g4.t1